MNVSKTQSPLIDKIDLISSLGSSSFYDFLKIVWPSIIRVKPVWNWHIEYLCDELQTVAERVFENKPKLYDLIINIPPATTKSTIASVAFPAWTWTRFPQAQHICASYEKNLAMNLGRDCRDIVLSDVYKQAWPHVKIREDQKAKSFFKLTEGGWRFSIGVDGNVIGRHAHFIILDDLINAQDAEKTSGADLTKVNEWTNSSISNRKVDPNVSVQILIMQRLHQNDPTGNRLKRIKEEGDIKHICLPADDEYEIKPRRLKRYYKKAGGYLDPIRLGPNVLKQYKAKGTYFYAGQYGQNPIPKGGGMIKVAKFRYDFAPKSNDLQQIVRYWDLASTDDGGDYTVGVKVGLHKNGRYYILHVVRGQWDVADRDKIIKDTAVMDGPDVEIGLEEEGGSSGKSANYYLMQSLRGFIVNSKRPTGDKAHRARPFAGEVGAANVVIVPGEWNQEYVDELKFFPRGQYDDQVDATSGAVNLINESFHAEMY